jgi:hypothetical protein
MKHALLISLVLAAACGGKSAPQAPAHTDPTPLAAGAWEGMDDKARADFMKHTVMPVMSAKFKAFDAEEFGDMKCATCHGPGVAEGKFEMPSGALHELDFANPDPDDAKIHEFMEQEVKPTMAKLLGKTEWSPDNQAGFGCLGCHTMKQ